MIRILFFLFVSVPVFAQTRCDTLAHDNAIYRKITAVQTRQVGDLKFQVSELTRRAAFSDSAIADLEQRANEEIVALRQRYAGYIKPPTRWERLRKGAGTFAAGVGSGILLVLLL